MLSSHLSSIVKQCLLPAYYYGSWPLRRLGQSLAQQSGRQPISILFYHRVADDAPSPWTISTRDFTHQIEWLEKNFEVISLAEAQRRIANNESARPAVCITFDDGYADNCRQALPLLISRGIPCTYFVSTDFVLQGKPFPHDVARGTPLAPNSVRQLQSLANSGIEIGAHTRSHCDLGPITDPEILFREIRGSRDDLQERLGHSIAYFAFPYGQTGNLSPLAFQVARQAGFAGVCSAYGGYNHPGGDPFHLQRIHADPNFLRLKNWLTLEPRLWRRQLQVDPAPANSIEKADR